MATTVNSIVKLRRGPDSERQTLTFESGEIVFSTDIKRVFIGDNDTLGGILVGNKAIVSTTPSPSAIQGDLFFNINTNVLYMLSSTAGGDNINNYAQVSPIADGITLKYINGKLSIDESYFNNPSTGFVRLSGDTMNGFLTLHHPPTATMHAANKGWVDTTINNTIKTIGADIETKFVHISGDKMTGPLEIDNTLKVNGASNFQNDVDFNDSLIKKFRPIIKNVSLNAGTNTYQLLPSDNGSVIVVDSSDHCFVSIPPSLILGYNALIIKKFSAFTLSFKSADAGNPVTIMNVANRVTMGNLYSVCNIIAIANNEFVIAGDLI